MELWNCLKLDKLVWNYSKLIKKSPTYYETA